MSWWLRGRCCWGKAPAGGRSGKHFSQVLGQYPLKKLYLGKGAHAQIARRNLQVSQKFQCGASERSLAVIKIKI